jgi:hypothetical protein
VQSITAYAASLEDLVFGTGNHQHLPERGIPLDKAHFLQEVSAHSPGGLTEELGDVENAEAGRRTEPAGQL